MFNQGTRGVAKKHAPACAALDLIRDLQAMLEEVDMLNGREIDQVNNVYYALLNTMPQSVKDAMTDL